MYRSRCRLPPSRRSPSRFQSQPPFLQSLRPPCRRPIRSRIPRRRSPNNPRRGAHSRPANVEPMRWLALAAIGALLLAAPAAGDVYGRKHSVDARISALHWRAAVAQQRAEQLVAEIDSVNARIHGLEARVGDVNSRLAALETDLALHRRRLDGLTELFKVQTRRYTFLRRQYWLAVARMNARIVALYEQGDA